MFTVELHRFINNRNKNCSIKFLITPGTQQANLLYYTPKSTYIQLGLTCYKITQSIKLVCSNVCNYKFVYFTIINQIQYCYRFGFWLFHDI